MQTDSDTLMALRETINENKGISWIIGVILVGGACFFTFRNLSSVRPAGYRTSFYSTDDGKTFFEDRSDLLPPFMHEGKEAVKVTVYSCDNGKTRFAGYLERLTPDARAEIEKYKASGSMPDTPTQTRLLEGGSQMKLPGQTKWSRKDAFGYAGPPIKCPDGKSVAMPVVPDAPSN